MNIFAILTLLTLQLSQLPMENEPAFESRTGESLVLPETRTADPEALQVRTPVNRSRTTRNEALPTQPPLGAAEDNSTTAAEGTQHSLRNFTNPQAQLQEWYHAAYEFITTRGLQLLFNVVAAAVIFFIGRKLARMATQITSEVMERMGTDPILIKFAANLLYCALLGMISLAALKMVGVETDSAIAMIAAAGFAVGLALQGSLANFAAGIMLIVFKPFNVGDEIEAGGQTGNVEEVNMFNTILRTNGNVRIIIPNGQVTSGTIKNFTAQRIRLIELKVGCGYCDDLKAVKAFLDRIVRTDTRVVKDPGPAVAVSELGDFSVVFSVKCWVATREYGDLRSALLERIKLGFDEEGYTFPYPSRDVYVHQSNATISKAA